MQAPCKSAAHTPGPWRVDPDYDRDVQSGDGSVEIATAEGFAPMVDGCDYQVPSSYDEAYANARLIAAAPELLEALRDMLPRFRDLRELAGCGESDLSARAAAAIAKATGSEA